MALSSYVCLDRATMKKIESMHLELVRALEHVAGLLATPPVLAPVGQPEQYNGPAEPRGDDPTPPRPVTQPVYGTWSCINQDCRVLEFQSGRQCPSCAWTGR